MSTAFVVLYKHFLIEVEVCQTSSVTRVPFTNTFYRENFCIQQKLRLAAFHIQIKQLQ